MHSRKCGAGVSQRERERQYIGTKETSQMFKKQPLRTKRKPSVKPTFDVQFIMLSITVQNKARNENGSEVTKWPI